MELITCVNPKGVARTSRVHGQDQIVSQNLLHHPFPPVHEDINKLSKNTTLGMVCDTFSCYPLTLFKLDTKKSYKGCVKALR